MDVDAMSLVKVDGLMKGGQNTGSFFIWKEAGEGDAGMVIDGDVEGFSTCAWVTMGTITGGANARLMKAAKLFNIKMKEFTWSGAFVTENGRLGWIESPQAIEAVALEDPGKGSF